MNPRVLATAFSLFVCASSDAPGQAGNSRDAAEAINHSIRANHFRPAELNGDAYRRIEKDDLKVLA